MSAFCKSLISKVNDNTDANQLRNDAPKTVRFAICLFNFIPTQAIFHFEQTPRKRNTLIARAKKSEWGKASTPHSVANRTFEHCQPEAGRKSVRKPYRTRTIRIILKISEAQCLAIVHFKCASRKRMARHLAHQIQHTLQFNGLILWANERTILYLLQKRTRIEQANRRWPHW